jgi:hypothetical protein
MLPACRTDSEGFAIPIFDLTPPDVEGLLEELWEFQSPFTTVFPAVRRAPISSIIW